MKIGWVADPLNWDRWPEAAELLEPARARSDEVIELLEPSHLLWVVMDGDELLAAATARICVDASCEVMLVGGRDHRRWLKELNDELGREARNAGALRLTAMGRRGWTKILRAHGWDSSEWDFETNIYTRDLRTNGESTIKQNEGNPS